MWERVPTSKKVVGTAFPPHYTSAINRQCFFTTSCIPSSASSPKKSWMSGYYCFWHFSQAFFDSGLQLKHVSRNFFWQRIPEKCIHFLSRCWWSHAINKLVIKKHFLLRKRNGFTERSHIPYFRLGTLLFGEELDQRKVKRPFRCTVSQKPWNIWQKLFNRIVEQSCKNFPQKLNLSWIFCWRQGR